MKRRPSATGLRRRSTRCERPVSGEGRRIVVYGASGSLGTAAVQLAKHFGAHVTAVCGTDHVELVRSLGADEVIDYRKQDFTKNGQTYDAIIDAVGKYSFRRGRRALKPGGIYVATDGGRFLLETLGFYVATRFVGSKRVTTAIGRRIKHGCAVLQGAHRGRRVPRGRRSALPDGPGGRGAPLRRVVAQGGQRRPDHRDGSLRAEMISRPLHLTGWLANGGGRKSGGAVPR